MLARRLRPTVGTFPGPRPLSAAFLSFLIEIGVTGHSHRRRGHPVLARQGSLRLPGLISSPRLLPIERSNVRPGHYLRPFFVAGTLKSGLNSRSSPAIAAGTSSGVLITSSRRERAVRPPADAHRLGLHRLLRPLRHSTGKSAARSTARRMNAASDIRFCLAALSQASF